MRSWVCAETFKAKALKGGSLHRLRLLPPCRRAYRKFKHKEDPPGRTPNGFSLSLLLLVAAFKASVGHIVHGRIEEPIHFGTAAPRLTLTAACWTWRALTPAC